MNATDAFGIAIGDVYDMNEPKGLKKAQQILDQALVSNDYKYK